MLCLFLLLRSRCVESRTLQGEKFAILKCISLACGLYWAGNNQDSGRIFDLPADCSNTFRLESLIPEWSFPGGASGREPTHQRQRCKGRGFDPWVGKIPCRRKWQPTPVFLPRASHGQRSLAGYSPWGHKESDTTQATERTHTHTHTHTSQNRACTRDMWQGARCGMIFMLAFIIYKHKYILYMICDRLDVVGKLKRAWSLDAVPLSPPSPAKTLQSFAFLSPCELSSPFEVPNHYPGNLFCF